MPYTLDENTPAKFSFLKNKQEGNIKVYTVAGGNKQRAFIPKENVSSPTVST